MSTKDPNMKVIIGADTKDFDKGAKAVKQGLNDLDKVGGQLLGSLGNMFGVNTAKIGQMASAMKGLGTKMSECGSAGVSAFGKVLSAINPVGVAIAGLGIGAAVAGFKELQKEAEAFKSTVAGANMEMATSAYIETYKQILRDFNGDAGKAIAETESMFKKAWGTLGITLREFFTTGAFQGGYHNPTGAAAMEDYFNRIGAATEGGQKAEDISNQIYQLERKRKEQSVVLAELNADIADQMQIAKDATVKTAERQEAIYKIELMQSQKRAMTVPIEQELARLYKERSKLASDGEKAADATIAQSVRAFEVDRAMTLEETALLKVKNSIGKATDAEIARMKKLLEQQKKLQEEIDKVRSKWSTVAEAGAVTGGSSPAFPGVTAPKLDILPRVDGPYWREVINAQLGDITIGIGFKADTEKIQNITNEVTNLMQSGVARAGEIIGSLVGTLAGGGDAWGDFKNAALSAFGDMAIAVGKIAISAGIASKGIQAALRMDNPWIAIAAGAALVALGTAVKSSLSAVASGDYSAGAGGYSGGGYSSGGGSDYETREVKVYVTGTLEADGDKLITVINNANNKNYYTR